MVDRSVLTDMSMVVNRENSFLFLLLKICWSNMGLIGMILCMNRDSFQFGGVLWMSIHLQKNNLCWIDFFGDEVESIRFFDVETQLSEQRVEQVSIVPDLSGLSEAGNCKHTDLFSYFSLKPVWWIKNGMFC